MGESLGIREINLSSKGLSEVGWFDKDKFTFIVRNHDFEVSRFQACFFSGKVRRLLAGDATIDRLVVNVGDCTESLFSDVIALMNGLSVAVTDENMSFIERVCVDLENREVFDILFESDVKAKKLSLDNVVHRLQLRKGMGISYKEELDFLAGHFNEITDKLDSVCDDDIDSVLESDSLRLTDEESLLEFVVARRDCDSYELPLLRHVRPEFLSDDSLSDYLLYARESGLWDVWAIICECVQGYVHSCHGRERELLFRRYIETTDERIEREGRDLVTKFKGVTRDGILAYIRSKCGGNVHDKGFVNVTVSSTCDNEQPKRLADRSWDSLWYSSNEPNSWVMFDFKDSCICPTHYTVRCNDGGYPKNWELSGSNDGNSWTVLDRRDTKDLSDYDCHCFSCEANGLSFSLIRLMQTGKSNCYDDYCLYLSEVEFFGMMRSLVM